MTSFGKAIFFVMIIDLRCCHSHFTNSCPEPSLREKRSRIYCNSTHSAYICVKDLNKGNYIEICQKEPELYQRGYKAVWRGNLDSKKCDPMRYQPVIFSTDYGSDCILKSSKCADEGQIIVESSSSVKDIKCGCDYAKGYAFVKQTNNPCFCVPSEEDCTCYLKQCPPFHTLSADYSCEREGDDHDNLVCSGYSQRRVVEDIEPAINNSKLLLVIEEITESIANYDGHKADVAAAVGIVLCLLDIVLVLMFYSTFWADRIVLNKTHWEDKQAEKSSPKTKDIILKKQSKTADLSLTTTALLQTSSERNDAKYRSEIHKYPHFILPNGVSLSSSYDKELSKDFPSPSLQLSDLPQEVTQACFHVTSVVPDISFSPDGSKLHSDLTCKQMEISCANKKLPTFLQQPTRTAVRPSTKTPSPVDSEMIYERNKSETTTSSATTLSQDVSISISHDSLLPQSVYRTNNVNSHDDLITSLQVSSVSPDDTLTSLQVKCKSSDVELGDLQDTTLSSDISTSCSQFTSDSPDVSLPSLQAQRLSADISKLHPEFDGSENLQHADNLLDREEKRGSKHVMVEKIVDEAVEENIKKLQQSHETANKILLVNTTAGDKSSGCIGVISRMSIRNKRPIVVTETIETQEEDYIEKIIKPKILSSTYEIHAVVFVIESGCTNIELGVLANQINSCKTVKEFVIIAFLYSDRCKKEQTGYGWIKSPDVQQFLRKVDRRYCVISDTLTSRKSEKQLDNLVDVVESIRQNNYLLLSFIHSLEKGFKELGNEVETLFRKHKKVVLTEENTNGKRDVNDNINWINRIDLAETIEEIHHNIKHIISGP